MKINLQHLWVFSLCAIILLGWNTVRAEENTTHKKSHPVKCQKAEKPNKQKWKEKWKEKCDLNKDGTVDDAERAIAKETWEKKREQRHVEMLAKYDANQDGELDKTEREAMRKAHHEEMLAKYDTDKDGKLSKEEREAQWKDKRGE